MLNILPKLYPQIQTKDKFYLFVGLFTKISNLDLWHNISSVQQNTIKNFINTGDVLQVAWTLTEGIHIEELKLPILKYIYSVKVKDLVQIFTTTSATQPLFELFKSRIIYLYKTVDNWDANNLIVRKLLHPFFASLEETDIDGIKKFVLEDKNIKDSTSLPQLIRDIYEYGCYGSVDKKHELDAELIQNGLKNMTITDEQFEELIPF